MDLEQWKWPPSPPGLVNNCMARRGWAWLGGFHPSSCPCLAFMYPIALSTHHFLTVASRRPLPEAKVPEFPHHRHSHARTRTECVGLGVAVLRKGALPRRWTLWRRCHRTTPSWALPQVWEEARGNAVVLARHC